jgi:malate dehydrogenase
VVTNPVNSTVPVAAVTLKKAGVFDPARLIGVTTLEVVRASTFTAQALGGNNDPKLLEIALGELKTNITPGVSFMSI